MDTAFGTVGDPTALRSAMPPHISYPEHAAMSSTRGAGKSAAEEPEPEPGPPSPTSTAASYNPREYQPPHPDDRGKPTLSGAKGTEGGTHRCGNCDAPDAKSKCTRCCVERYCGKKCQAVHAARRGCAARRTPTRPLFTPPFRHHPARS